MSGSDSDDFACSLQRPAKGDDASEEGVKLPKPKNRNKLGHAFLCLKMRARKAEVRHGDWKAVSFTTQLKR